MLQKPMAFDAPGWTTNTNLPGGNIENADFPGFLVKCEHQYPWLDEEVLHDYARNYGTDIELLLQDCSSMDDLGENFGGGLYKREVNYLITYEWAETPEDILWRRTKKGLRVPEGTDKHLQAFISNHRQNWHKQALN
jgi:glycerol-3-phosphate dehydrogenase